MSFLKKGFIVAIIAQVFFFSASQKTYGYAGVADVVIDPTNLAQNSITAIGVTKDLLKDFLLDGIAWSVANSMIQKITAQTVNWINSGFKGNPAYVTDPGQFFLNLGDEGASRFLSGTNFNQLCAPFRNQVRLSLVKNYLSESVPQNFSCTIGGVIKNYNDFTQDFTQGGWDGWFAVTQNSSNNPYGAYLDAKSELGSQNNNVIAKYSNQLDQGKGFLSYERCKPHGATTNTYSAGNSGTAGEQATGQELYDQCLYDNGGPESETALTICEGYKDYTPSNQSEGSSNVVGSSDCAPGDRETVTPGSVIGDQLGKILGKGVDRLGVVDSINQVVGALMTQMIGRVVGGGGGGTGLLGASKSSGSTTGARKSLTSQLSPVSVESFDGSVESINELVTNADPSTKSPLPTPPGAPIIVLKGSNPMSMQDGDKFIDPGAYGFDPKDGDISKTIVSTRKDDELYADRFTVTYSAKNSSGLSANPVTRRVDIIFPAGSCGTAAATYRVGITNYGNNPQFCTIGYPAKKAGLFGFGGTKDIDLGQGVYSYTPAFPDKGDKTEWICLTQYEVQSSDDIGDTLKNAPKCTARSLAPIPPVKTQ
jgi:hypothetical protein